MISVTETAQDYFRRLMEQQGLDDVGLRMLVSQPGTPAADCQLAFCPEGEQESDDVIVPLEGFNLYIDATSAPWLDDAKVDYETDDLGGQISVKAPNIKGEPPDGAASLADQVDYVLQAEINPAIAAHGGVVTLVEVTTDNTVVLQFGGGCHGCGMVDVTLKEGIEKTLKERVPEIEAVRDVTDHATGENPYY
jgi:Fe/S biogenesis protein NfuA